MFSVYVTVHWFYVKYNSIHTKHPHTNSHTSLAATTCMSPCRWPHTLTSPYPCPTFSADAEPVRSVQYDVTKSVL